jgi:hypothetical protein
MFCIFELGAFDLDRKSIGILERGNDPARINGIAQP